MRYSSNIESYFKQDSKSLPLPQNSKVEIPPIYSTFTTGNLPVIKRTKPGRTTLNTVEGGESSPEMVVIPYLSLSTPLKTPTGDDAE